MLIEQTLFGEENKINKAIKRLQAFDELATNNNKNGFIVCDSGGKDSNIIKELAYLSKINFEIIHNHTTIDHHKTNKYIRLEQIKWNNLGIKYTISKPIYKGQYTNMYKLCSEKGAPTRLRRWCCKILKEQSHLTKNRYIITGVRWAESVQRKKNRGIFEMPNGTTKKRIILNNDNDTTRRMIESCQKTGQFVLNPIIDWTNDEIWEFIRQYNIEYNPLYDEGYKRVGCIGCPMSKNNNFNKDTQQYKNMYIKAYQTYLDNNVEVATKYNFNDGQNMFNWWISKKSIDEYNNNTNQITIYDK